MNIFNSPLNKHYIRYYLEHLSEEELLNARSVNREWYAGSKIVMSLKGPLQGETYIEKLKNGCLTNSVIRLKKLFNEMKETFHVETYKKCLPIIYRKCANWACEGGYLMLVQFFICDKMKSTLLQTASMYNHTHIIDYILKCAKITMENNIDDASVNNTKRILLTFGLTGACISGNLELVKKYLEYLRFNFDVNQYLYYAYSGCGENIKQSQSKYISIKKNIEVINYIETTFKNKIQSHFRSVCLNLSILSNNLDFIKQVYKKCIDENVVLDIGFEYKFESACQTGNQEIINYILERAEHHLNLNNLDEKVKERILSNVYGYGLIGAARGGHVSVAKQIISNGLKCKTLEEVLEEALEEASKAGKLEMCQFLEKYISPDQCASIHKEVFKRGCEYGHLPIVKEYISKVNNKTKAEGCQIAMVYNGYIDIADFIIPKEE